MFFLICVAVLSVLLVVAVMLRYASLPTRNESGEIVLRGIDLASFQNLISKEDDLFLRQSLKPDSYRKVKRARTRAVQEYHWWMSEDCARLQMNAKSAPATVTKESAQLIQTARLRIIALTLWCGQWLQWVFPDLDLTPGSILQRYEQTLAYARPYLQPHPQPTHSAV